MTTITLNDRELATVLAALRFYQRMRLTPNRSLTNADLDDILTNGGKVKPLDAGQIDELCELINLGGQPAKATEGTTKPAADGLAELEELMHAVESLKDFGGEGGIEAEERVKAALEAAEKVVEP